MTSRTIAQIAVNTRDLESLGLTAEECTRLRSLDKPGPWGEKPSNGYLEMGELMSGFVIAPRVVSRLFRAGVGKTSQNKALVHIFTGLSPKQKALLLTRLDSLQQGAVLAACSERDMELIVRVLREFSGTKFMGMILHQRFRGNPERVDTFVDQMFRNFFPTSTWEVSVRPTDRRFFQAARKHVKFLTEQQGRETAFYLPEKLPEAAVLKFVRRTQLQPADPRTSAAYALTMSKTRSIDGEVIVVKRDDVTAQSIPVGQTTPRPRLSPQVASRKPVPVERNYFEKKLGAPPLPTQPPADLPEEERKLFATALRLYRDGNAWAALDELKKGFNGDAGQNAPYHYLLGMIYTKIGDDYQAFNQFASADFFWRYIRGKNMEGRKIRGNDPSFLKGRQEQSMFIYAIEFILAYEERRAVEFLE